jgi:hypothetical protein
LTLTFQGTTTDGDWAVVQLVERCLFALCAAAAAATAACATSACAAAAATSAAAATAAHAIALLRMHAHACVRVCLCAAMKTHNVKRIAVVTSIGCGDSYYQAR